jgi:hypothetical protein
LQTFAREIPRAGHPPRPTHSVYLGGRRQHLGVEPAREPRGQDGALPLCQGTVRALDRHCGYWVAVPRGLHPRRPNRPQYSTLSGPPSTACLHRLRVTSTLMAPVWLWWLWFGGCGCGCGGCVQELVEHWGASLEIADEGGFTPVVEAAYHGHESCADAPLPAAAAAAASLPAHPGTVGIAIGSGLWQRGLEYPRFAPAPRLNAVLGAGCSSGWWGGARTWTCGAWRWAPPTPPGVSARRTAPSRRWSGRGARDTSPARRCAHASPILRLLARRA